MRSAEEIISWLESEIARYRGDVAYKWLEKFADPDIRPTYDASWIVCTVEVLERVLRYAREEEEWTY